ncbi:hypothetical protein J2853_002922 [Streptosporangium lutulentum]|uniref:Uncharacterized protein n=1 Tax=Streptosporangium lutulentum TaxID=1461250 RepID=A0ABT9QBI5_9ACTN|nr:hypothetical protein [Streptosporangium lutulentum]
MMNATATRGRSTVAITCAFSTAALDPSMTRSRRRSGGRPGVRCR